ncbi:hypothetical protein J1614_004900 [Plenodomus biglobosus]|nr:hypothetical protein J1614_004900 [Plenodomus biglobosus]
MQALQIGLPDECRWCGGSELRCECLDCDGNCPEVDYGCRGLSPDPMTKSSRYAKPRTRYLFGEPMAGLVVAIVAVAGGVQGVAGGALGGEAAAAVVRRCQSPRCRRGSTQLAKCLWRGKGAKKVRNSLFVLD